METENFEMKSEEEFRDLGELAAEMEARPGKLPVQSEKLAEQR